MAKPGRPTKYDKAFCEQAVAFLAHGYSVAALAGELGVSKQTLYNWQDEHPEFFDAVKRGQAKAALWWENVLRTCATTGTTSTAAIFGLKNRAPEEWRDRVEHSGPDGGPIAIQKIEYAIVDPSAED